MTGVRVTVTQTPSKAALERKLRKARAKLVGGEGMLRLHKRAAILLDRWVQKNFQTEGGGWEPFAVYKPQGRRGRWISRSGGRPGYLDTSAKLLRDTGALRLSFRPFATRKDAGIGSELDYAEFHEKGIGVPMRRMLPVNADVQGALKDLFERHARVVARHA